MFDPKVHVGAAIRLTRYNAVKNTTEVLLLHRNPAKATHGAGTWGLPGGWIDWGQSPEEAMVREAREETGLELDIREAKLVGAVSNTYEDKDMHVVCLAYDFKTYDATQLRNMEPEKHVGLEWVELGKLSSMPLFPPLESLAKLWGWI